MKWKNHKKKNKLFLITILISVILIILVLFNNGTVSIVKSGLVTILKMAQNTVTTETEQSIQKLSDVVNVGDYVQYDPSSSEKQYKYITNEAITGYSEEKVFQSTDSIKWRVLSVDKTTGKVELIAENGTPETMSFAGKEGAKNYENVLNDISAVYGHGLGAVNARSINYDDIKKYSTYTEPSATTVTITNGIVLEGNNEINAAEVEGGVDVTFNFVTYDLLRYISDSKVADVITKKVGASQYESPYKCFYIATRMITGNVNTAVYFPMCVNPGAGLQPSIQYMSNGTTNSFMVNLPVLPIVELNSNLKVSGKDDNGWIILNEREEDESKLFQAQVELSKVNGNDFKKIAGSTFKIEEMADEQSLKFKLYNAISGEEIQITSEGNFEVPEDGIVINLAGKEREKNYLIKISEVSAPEGKEKSLNYLVLSINVSMDDIITAKIIKIEDAEGNEIDLLNQKKARLVGADENGNIQIKLEDTNSDLEIQYHLGNDPTDLDALNTYNGELILEENAKIWARTRNENGNVSAWSIKIVDNIDKIAPIVDRSTINIIPNQATGKATLTLKIKDEASEENVAENLKKYGASGITEYGLSESDILEPKYKTDVNQELEVNVAINNITKNGTYYLWIWDAAGNLAKEPIEINVQYNTYVAQIISATATDGSDKFDGLIGTKYTTLESAIAACPQLGEGTATIQIIANIVNESNDVDRDITIDLAGCVINTESYSNNTPTLTVKDNCKLNIIDSRGNGSIINKKTEFANYEGEAIGVLIEENGFLQLGNDEGNVSIETPTIIGEGYGVYNKGRKENDEWIGGVFNFYDGKIIASSAKVFDININLSVYGNITDTPLLYKTSVTNETTPKARQIAILAQISDAEARIGRKTYTQIEDAIADAGTKYGKDGSQVEIIVVNNISKSKSIVIDNSKNIKLNLDGYGVTTQSTEPTITNYGDLEIVDTSEAQTGKVYSTTGDAIYNCANEIDRSTTTNIDVSKLKNYDDDSDNDEYDDEYGNEYKYIELDLKDYEGAYKLELKTNESFRYVTVTTEPLKNIAKADSRTFNLLGGEKYYINICGKAYIENDITYRLRRKYFL